MYFPFIRGRQYDLLALRELQSKFLINSNIIPIIEPVKFSSTLTSTVHKFIENDSKIVVIINPKVGSFQSDLKHEKVRNEFYSLLRKPNVITGYYLNQNSTSEIKAITSELDIKLEDFAIIHDDRNQLSIYEQIYNGVTPYINVIPQDNSFRRKIAGQNLVSKSDKFKKLLRNSDYLNNEEEFFSEEHLFFRDEGYIGFSDYSVIGAEFNEGGFAPYAVAFHIVFVNREGALDIRHFVSDSNDDTSDPAGKFGEALSKFYNWYEHSDFNDLMRTDAINTLIDHYLLGTYPGLPSIKKLSIMHHLELVSKLL